MDWSSLADHLRFAINASWVHLGQVLSTHSWFGMCGFLPFLILDVRRMAGTAVVMPLLRCCGLPPDRLAAQRRFLATRPRISVILAGFNEEDAITASIASLLEAAPRDLEIIVVDDGSEDRTFALARRYAQHGVIRLVRNSAASGRGGKPTAMNLGAHFATGGYLIFLDVDTSIDRDFIERMIGPFADPDVAVVAGNLLVRNWRSSWLTRMQAMEYLIGIGLLRRWLNFFTANYIASGACCAYRRTVFDSFGGCDVPIAEDLDNSLKAIRAGWRVEFASEAIATTDVPETLPALVRQRMRWNRDLLRVAFRKHLDLLIPQRHRLGVTIELWQILLMSVIANLVFPAYVALMLWYDPLMLLLLYALFLGLNAILAALSLGAAMLMLGRRRDHEAWLLPWVPLMPLYNELILRPLLLCANVLEILRINQDDPYIPQSAWLNAPRC